MWGCVIVAVSGILASVLHISSGLPCCSPDNNTLSQNNQTYCSDNTPIWLYNKCDIFYTIDPKLPPYETFHEDKEEVQLILHNDQWTTKNYCTFMKTDASKSGSEYKVAILCFMSEGKQNSLQFVVYGLCLIVSSIFLTATFIMYLLLPELRDLQGKCMMCFVFSLTVGYLSLAFTQLPFTAPLLTLTYCVSIAFNTYFWLLSAFCWLNITSFNMWRSTVLSHREFSEKKLLVSYLCAGWGIPIAFLLFAFITHIMPEDIGMIRPNFGVAKCWFQGNPELWSFFYGPVAVLIGLNIVYFISTAWYLWSDYSNPVPIPWIRSLRFKFTMYLKIFLTMGVTWVFEIISFIAAEDKIIWYITDTVNCLQGVIIFVVMVATRKRVLRAIGRRKLCGLNCSKKWETIDDEETEQQYMQEEIQLSNYKL